MRTYVARGKDTRTWPMCPYFAVRKERRESAYIDNTISTCPHGRLRMSLRLLVSIRCTTGVYQDANMRLSGVTCCVCPTANMRKEIHIYHRNYQDIVYPHAKVHSSSCTTFACVLMHAGDRCKNAYVLIHFHIYHAHQPLWWSLYPVPRQNLQQPSPVPERW